ncbi:MAG: O-methyltransferase [Thermoleophilia bacterium]
MILEKATSDYLDALRSPADPLTAEMEAYAAEHKVPIVSRETARLLGILARAAGARFVLEIGLAIGYSALHIARALPDYGKVVSLESDMHMASLARTYLARDPAGARVEILLGDAHETLPGLREIFDVIFIDADKSGYPGYLDLALERLRKTGLVVIDNLLMDGRVPAGRGDGHWSQTSVDTARELNRRLADDPALDFVLLPLGDGVGLVQRRPAR